MKEPKGLCPSCNEKSHVWYDPSLICHNKEAIHVGPCYHKKGFLRGHCYDCGAIESVVAHHKAAGKTYLGNGILLKK